MLVTNIPVVILMVGLSISGQVAPQQKPGWLHPREGIVKDTESPPLDPEWHPWGSSPARGPCGTRLRIPFQTRMGVLVASLARPGRQSSEQVPPLSWFLHLSRAESVGATSQDSLGRHPRGAPALVTPVISGIPQPGHPGLPMVERTPGLQ